MEHSIISLELTANISRKMISRVSRCLADKADNLSCDSPSLIQLGHFDILTRVSLMLCAAGGGGGGGAFEQGLELE